MKTLLCYGFLGVFLSLPVSGKEPFDNPAALFPHLSFSALVAHFEKVKIQSTDRGFYVRADTQPGFRHEYDPSEAGLYLDVAVRDSAEIPRFENAQKSSGKLTERTIDFPAAPGSPVALRITFFYGAKADTGSVTTLDKDIKAILKAYQKKHPELPISLQPSHD